MTTVPPVPSFVVHFTDDEINTTLESIRSILNSGRLVLGEYTERLEAEVAKMAGVQHALCVSTGSTALEIIYKMLAVEGKRVLAPTNTNFATVMAAVNAGAQVELYDSGLYPDTDSLLKRLDDTVGAVVVVHIGGYISPEMPKIVDACRRLGVPLVEDCAHAHGATLGGAAAGSFGDMAAFSFFPTKTITTGEGGAIVGNSPSIKQLGHQYRDQGKRSDGITHEVKGNSWRITEMGATLGLAQMKSLPDDVLRRHSIIARYTRELGDLYEFPLIPADSLLAGYKCIAFLPSDVSRVEFKRFIESQGVLLGKEVYEMPLHRQPVFTDTVSMSHFPVADDFAARHICLPLWRHMTDEQIARVVEALRRGAEHFGLAIS